MTVLPQLERELRVAHERQRSRRWRRALPLGRLAALPRGGFAAALATAVALAVALAGLVIVGHGASGGGPGARGIKPVTAPRPVNAQIVANFSPFRRPRIRADALPASIMHGLRYQRLLKRPLRFGCFGPHVPYPHISAAAVGLGSYYQLQCLTDQEAVRGVIFTGRAIITGLQLDQSRAVTLPGRLGTIWLIPSGGWLCNLLRSRILNGFPGHSSLTCEPISEVLAHPPLWTGAIFAASGQAAGGGYLLGLEPDWVTDATLGYPGGTQQTYLEHNLVGACIGQGSVWLEQTGPTRTEAITTPLGGGMLNGKTKRYRPARCPHLP